MTHAPAALLHEPARRVVVGRGLVVCCVGRLDRRAETLGGVIVITSTTQPSGEPQSHPTVTLLSELHFSSHG